MFYYASKVLWILGQPSNLIVFAIATAAVALLLGRGTLARWLLYPASAALLVISGIIVLGGGIEAGISERRGMATFGDTGERFTSLLELARRYPEARLVFSGGRSWLADHDLASMARTFTVWAPSASGTPTSSIASLR